MMVRHAAQNAIMMRVEHKSHVVPFWTGIAGVNADRLLHTCMYCIEPPDTADGLWEAVVVLVRAVMSCIARSGRQCGARWQDIGELWD